MHIHARCVLRIDHRSRVDRYGQLPGRRGEMCPVLARPGRIRRFRNKHPLPFGTPEYSLALDGDEQSRVVVCGDNFARAWSIQWSNTLLCHTDQVLRFCTDVAFISRNSPSIREKWLSVPCEGSCCGVA